MTWLSTQKIFYSKIVGSKINSQKLKIFLYTSDKQADFEIENNTIGHKGLDAQGKHQEFKYLFFSWDIIYLYEDGLTKYFKATLAFF